MDVYWELIESAREGSPFMTFDACKRFCASQERDIFNSFKFLLCEWNPLMSKVGGQKVMEMLTLKAVCIHQYWISIIKIDPEKKISRRWKLFFQLLSVQHHKQFRVKCCEWSFVEYSGNYFPRQTMGIAECCLDFLVFDWLQAFAPYVTSICREQTPLWDQRLLISEKLFSCACWDDP